MQLPNVGVKLLNFLSLLDTLTSSWSESTPNAWGFKYVKQKSGQYVFSAPTLDTLDNLEFAVKTISALKKKPHLFHKHQFKQKIKLNTHTYIKYILS